MEKSTIAICISLLIALITFSCSTESTPVYQLTTSVEPSEAGSVTPATAEVEEGDSIEVSATANEHWVFDRWSGDYSGTDNPASIVMDADKSVTALFEKQDYPLTIEIEGEGSVSQQVIQSKTSDYPHGTLVELTAEPDAGWEFIEWGGDASSDENPINVTVEGETTVTATFERIEYPLTIEIEGQGNVEQSVVQSKTTDYPEGTVVELEAIADENWLFSDWSGDLEGDDNPATITIDEPKTVTVTFLRTYKLTTIAEPDEGGSVIPTDTTIARNTDIEVEALPNHGWEFTGWEGDYSGDSNPINLTMDGHKTLTANFKRIDYPLTVTTQGEGVVEQKVVQQKTTEYPFETVVELTAIPAEGWVFTGWEGDLEGSDNPKTIAITEEKNVTALFERDYFDVMVNIEGEGKVDIVLEGGNQDNGQFEYESVLTLTAIADDGWEFDGWQKDLESNENPETITVEGETIITALFTKKEYSLTITIEGEGEVEKEIISTPKTTEYPFETVVELTAIPAKGWEFIGWSGDISSTDAVTEVRIEDETNITATFERIEYPLTIEIEGQGNVEQSVVQSKTTDYPEGTVVELEAIADENWLFSGWSGDLEDDENPATITIDEPKTVTATFLRTYKLTTITQPNEGGSIIPQDTVLIRDTDIDIEAIANEGWYFTYWEGDYTGSVNPFNLTMNGNKTVVANFEREEYTLVTEAQGEGDILAELISGSETADGYLFGSEVKLTATADESWIFSHWTGDIDGDENPIELTITENTHVKAHFDEVFNLSENGITIKCPLASPGDKGIVNGVEYEAVDRELLIQRRDEGADLSKLCVSLITDMGEMFLDMNFNQPIGNWDVSNVTNMKQMFWQSTFNQTIEKWDVSNVIDMNGMFYQSLFNKYIGNWDVSNVREMIWMFAESEFNQPIGDWDVNNVKNMLDMFRHSDFNQPIGDWNVSNVTVMKGMFQHSGFNQDIGKWNVSNVTDMAWMFSYAPFNQDISEWDVSNVTNMKCMFQQSTFDQPIGKWDVSNVTDMNGMFNWGQFNQPIGDWDVGEVTDMSFMFANGTPFNQDIGNWDVDNVKEMNYMFYQSSFNRDISRWCVTHIPNEPEEFSTGSPLNEGNKPIWGTCPE